MTYVIYFVQTGRPLGSDSEEALMLRTDRFYIGGSWQAPTGSSTIEVVNPATEQVITSVPAGTAEDADRAARAAAAAFDDWSSRSPKERAEWLDKICDALQAHRDHLVETIMEELGMPRAQVEAMQVDLVLTESRQHAELARTIDWEETIGNSTIVKEPVGVVAAITPWNFPLVQIMRKVAPAMVAGCTVVVKPSEVTPINAFILGEVLDEIGLPAGVVNILTGLGPVVGEALAAHELVDMVSLTGSTGAGRRVLELASQSVKRVAVELGGKSPMVVLEDADLEAAAQATLNWTYLNSGQVCSALTRLLVPKNKLKEAEAAVLRASESVKMGPPDQDDVAMGPLVSETQRDRVLGYIERGIDEGAKLILDGRPNGDSKGYYVGPTVFSDVAPGMTIEQEEIFGPVLSIIGYEDTDDAVRIANQTIYGLAAAVYSADEAKARDVARRLRAGQVEINGGAFNPLAPFGGFKQSGRGRENGHFALEEFLEIKSLQH